jgi:hypothetical protein
MSFVSGSRIAIDISPEPRIWPTRSPTASMIAWKSSCLASAVPISLTTASSALRCSVSPRRRFVSSNRRTFSSATLRLAASVVSRRTSASLNASSRSRFCSEMTPVTSAPLISGTNNTDLAASP